MHGQKGITFTVLSEDKFVYAPGTDIPPDKETACITQSYRRVARSTLIICNPAKRRVCTLTETHIRIHYESQRIRGAGGLLYFKKAQHQNR